MNEIEKVQDFLFYNSEDGSVKVQVLVDAETETIWATQKAMADLFGVSVPNISYHLKNIFQSGELESDTVIKKILITAQNGARGLSDSKIKYYNLDCRPTPRTAHQAYILPSFRKNLYGRPGNERTVYVDMEDDPPLHPGIT